MTVSKKDSQLVILLSGIVIVIPMVVFPARFGIEMTTGSFTYAIIEILWYAAVFFVMRSQASVLQIFQGAGLTFLYRIIVGTIFGLFLSIMYGVSISASLSLGVSRYFPAILLHILTAPFIVKPYFLAIIGENTERPLKKFQQKAKPESDITDQPYFNRKEDSVNTESSSTTASSVTTEKQSAKTAEVETRPEFVFGQDTNGFERAVRYLAEQSAIKLAAVVDHEGLPLASFHREGIDPEQWLPLTELFKERINTVLDRNYQSPNLQRIDLYVEHERIFILTLDQLCIMVIANREDDDLVGVRLHQAAEMVKKYVSERYGNLKPAGTEEKYVSSTGRTE